MVVVRRKDNGEDSEFLYIILWHLDLSAFKYKFYKCPALLWHTVGLNRA